MDAAGRRTVLRAPESPRVGALQYRTPLPVHTQGRAAHTRQPRRCIEAVRRQLGPKVIDRVRAEGATWETTEGAGSAPAGPVRKNPRFPPRSAAAGRTESTDGRPSGTGWRASGGWSCYFQASSRNGPNLTYGGGPGPVPNPAQGSSHIRHSRRTALVPLSLSFRRRLSAVGRKQVNDHHLRSRAVCTPIGHDVGNPSAPPAWTGLRRPGAGAPGDALERGWSSPPGWRPGAMQAIQEIPRCRPAGQ